MRPVNSWSLPALWTLLDDAWAQQTPTDLRSANIAMTLCLKLRRLLSFSFFTIYWSCLKWTMAKICENEQDIHYTSGKSFCQKTKRRRGLLMKIQDEWSSYWAESKPGFYLQCSGREGCDGRREELGNGSRPAASRSRTKVGFWVPGASPQKL